MARLDLAHPLLPKIRDALRGFGVYAVGGVVRDALLDKKSLDMDLVLVPETEEPLREFRLALRALEGGLGVKAKKSQFHTAKITFGKSEVDLALARIEEYPEPGALPLVRPSFSLEEDLRRRDFACNAVASTLEGRVIDPLGGTEDIRARVLRALHGNSFRDDPTRAFRCVRYMCHLGFSVSPETEAQFPGARKYLGNVSFPRIKHELARASALPERVCAWAGFAEKGLLPGALADPAALKKLSARAPGAPESWVLFYALLAEDVPPGLTRRERRILQLVQKNRKRSFRDLGEVHEALRTAPGEALLVLGVLESLVEKYRKARALAKPLLSPEEIAELGFSGKALGHALVELEKARLGGLVRTREHERKFLRGLRDAENIRGA